MGRAGQMGRFSRLEDQYRRSLERNGLPDPMDAGRRWVRKSILPKEVKKNCFIRSFRISRIFRGLENLSTQGAHVESVIFCTGSDDLIAFDDFGRPIRTVWEKRPLPLDDEQLKLVYGPEEQVSYASKFLSSIEDQRNEVVNIGVLDPEVKENLIVQSEWKSLLFLTTIPRVRQVCSHPFTDGWFLFTNYSPVVQ